MKERIQRLELDQRWFRKGESWAVLGPIALRLGPFGCGAALFAVAALFCVTLTLAAGGVSLLGFCIFRSDEVGVVEQVEVRPTASPTERPAASPTPSSIPTEEPARAACDARSEAPEGDTFNRDTGGLSRLRLRISWKWPAAVR